MAKTSILICLQDVLKNVAMNVNKVYQLKDLFNLTLFMN